MNLLPAMILYLTVGCGEWFLALRRTLACTRGETTVLICIVFIENLLGLWVLSNFIRTNNWLLAVCYSAGASAGALIVAMNNQEMPDSVLVQRELDNYYDRPSESIAGLTITLSTPVGHLSSAASDSPRSSGCRPSLEAFAGERAVPFERPPRAFPRTFEEGP